MHGEGEAVSLSILMSLWDVSVSFQGMFLLHLGINSSPLRDLLSCIKPPFVDMQEAMICPFDFFFQSLASRLFYGWPEAGRVIIEMTAVRGGRWRVLSKLSKRQEHVNGVTMEKASGAVPLSGTTKFCQNRARRGRGKGKGHMFL